MISRKTILISLLVSLTLISSYFSYYQWEENDSYLDDYRCRSSLSIFNYKLSTQIAARFHFSGQTGRLIYDGPVFDGTTLTGFINKDIHFDIIRDDGQLILKSITVVPLSKDTSDDSVTGRLFPDFFLKKNESFIFELEKNDSGLLFIHDSVPMFYCEKE